MIDLFFLQISESKAADGLFVDVGTQTHSFHSAPFTAKTTLAEVMVDRPLKLHLQLQAESVNSRNNRASCVFTFLCGHTFHRREFSTHYRCLFESELTNAYLRNLSLASSWSLRRNVREQT